MRRYGSRTSDSGAQTTPGASSGGAGGRSASARGSIASRRRAEVWRAAFDVLPLPRQRQCVAPGELGDDPELPRQRVDEARRLGEGGVELRAGVARDDLDVAGPRPASSRSSGSRPRGVQRLVPGPCLEGGQQGVGVEERSPRRSSARYSRRPRASSPVDLPDVVADVQPVRAQAASAGPRFTARDGRPTGTSGPTRSPAPGRPPGRRWRRAPSVRPTARGGWSVRTWLVSAMLVLTRPVISLSMHLDARSWPAPARSRPRACAALTAVTEYEAGLSAGRGQEANTAPRFAPSLTASVRAGSSAGPVSACRAGRAPARWRTAFPRLPATVAAFPIEARTAEICLRSAAGTMPEVDQIELELRRDLTDRRRPPRGAPPPGPSTPSSSRCPSRMSDRPQRVSRRYLLRPFSSGSAISVESEGSCMRSPSPRGRATARRRRRSRRIRWPHALRFGANAPS